MRDEKDERIAIAGEIDETSEVAEIVEATGIVESVGIAAGTVSVETWSGELIAVSGSEATREDKDIELFLMTGDLEELLTNLHEVGVRNSDLSKRSLVGISLHFRLASRLVLLVNLRDLVVAGRSRSLKREGEEMD